MNLFDSIVNYLKGEKKTIEAPEEYCPNCWSFEEYEGKIRTQLEIERIDLNNVKSKKGWIQAYAVQNLEGIKAKNGSKTCPTCQVNYKHSH